MPKTIQTTPKWSSTEPTADEIREEGSAYDFSDISDCSPLASDYYKDYRHLVFNEQSAYLRRVEFHIDVLGEKHVKIVVSSTPKANGNSTFERWLSNKSHCFSRESIGGDAPVVFRAPLTELKDIISLYDALGFYKPENVALLNNIKGFYTNANQKVPELARLLHQWMQQKPGESLPLPFEGMPKELKDALRVELPPSAKVPMTESFDYRSRSTKS